MNWHAAACLAQQVNNAVVASAREHRTKRMGSTLAALFFATEKVYITNLGDSRIYRFRNNTLSQVSYDHVARDPKYPRKAPLTQYLGIYPEDLTLEPHVVIDKPEIGDYYLLCSDGLTDMVSDEGIAQILGSGASAEDCVNALMQAALNYGGRDNVTIIICKAISDKPVPKKKSRRLKLRPVKKKSWMDRIVL